MSNPKQTTIKLRELFGPTLSTRQVVTVITDHIPTRAKEVCVDFSEITFVSRSFAHEFLRFQETSDIPIKRSHFSQEVQQIFTLVDKSRRQHKQHDHKDEITDTSIRLSDHSLAF